MKWWMQPRVQPLHFTDGAEDDSLNDWLDNYYAPRLKEKYDITLERVPMDIDAILSQISGEFQQIKRWRYRYDLD